MSNFTVQLFARDLIASFHHYEKAFQATFLFDAKADDGTLIHLEMDVMGNRIALAPPLPCGNIKGNITVLCLKFPDRQSLMTAYNTLIEGGQSQGLQTFPWSPLQGYVTDKFGVNWCIGI